MSRHIYNLRDTLTRKTHHPKRACSIFLRAMTTACVLFVLLPLSQTASSARPIDKTNMIPFVSIYEPSGMVYLGEGCFLVVEDEPERPFHLLKINTEGRLYEAGELKVDGTPVLLNDLEGVTFDGQYIYAITSHSQNKSGNAGSGRMALVRYIYRDGALYDQRLVSDIKQIVVSKIQPVFSSASLLDIWEKIDIEALGWSPQTKKLYIAFRAPLHDGNSLVVVIDNPDQIFSQASAAQANIELRWLNFENNGVRAMSWDAGLNGFFMVTGRANTRSGGHDLWEWSGLAKAEPVKLTSDDEALPQGTEGVATFHTQNADGMIVVVDDGNQALDNPGHYKLVSMSTNLFNPIEDTQR